jgi:hypothetical protein
VPSVIFPPSQTEDEKPLFYCINVLRKHSTFKVSTLRYQQYSTVNLQTTHTHTNTHTNTHMHYYQLPRSVAITPAPYIVNLPNRYLAYVLLYEQAPTVCCVSFFQYTTRTHWASLCLYTTRTLTRTKNRVNTNKIPYTLNKFTFLNDEKYTVKTKFVGATLRLFDAIRVHKLNGVALLEFDIAKLKHPSTTVK